MRSIVVPEEPIARSRKVREFHGLRNSPEYRAWYHMIDRCHNPHNQDYQYYGGRGIKVCSEWLKSFSSFYESMGRRPTIRHSIDRIDNDGDYKPSNCRWATKTQQSINQRRRLDNTSGYRGVSWFRSTKRWVVKVRYNGQSIHLGYFRDPVEAAYVRDQAVLQLHDTYAALNFKY